MLWTIIVVLLVLWLLGLLVHIGGNLIHILLVIALIILFSILFKANEDSKRDNKIDSPLFARAFQSVCQR